MIGIFNILTKSEHPLESLRPNVVTPSIDLQTKTGQSASASLSSSSTSLPSVPSLAKKKVEPSSKPLPLDPFSSYANTEFTPYLMYLKKNAELLNQTRSSVAIKAEIQTKIEQLVEERVKADFSLIEEEIQEEIQIAKSGSDTILTRWKWVCRNLIYIPTWAEFCQDPSQPTPPDEIEVSIEKQAEIAIRVRNKHKDRWRQHFQKENRWPEVAREELISKIESWEREELPLEIKQELQKIEALRILNPAIVRSTRIPPSWTSLIAIVEILLKHYSSIDPSYLELPPIERRRYEISIIKRAFKRVDVSL